MRLNPRLLNNIKKFFLRNIHLLAIAVWLFTIAFIINNYWAGNKSTNGATRIVQNYVDKQTIDFKKNVAIPQIVDSIVTKNYSENLAKKLIAKNYFIYIYQKDQTAKDSLVFWNTQVIQPNKNIVEIQDSIGFSHLANGYYVWRKNVVNKKLVIALILIQWDYPITNDYLENSFVIDKDLSKNYAISEEQTALKIVSIKGDFLFSLVKLPENAFLNYNMYSIICTILGVLFIFLFIQQAAIKIAKENWGIATLFLLITFICSDIVSCYLPQSINIHRLSFFNPIGNSHNIFLFSLGSIFINALFFAWITLFVAFYVKQKRVYLNIHLPIFKWLVIIAGCLLLLGCTFFLAYIIRIVINDDKISFDVINFFTLSIYSFIAFFILGCISIAFLFFTQTVIYLLRPLLQKNTIILVYLTTIIGFFILSFVLAQIDITFELLLALWLMLYLYLSSNLYFNLTTFKIVIISTRTLFWFFFLSLSISTIILINNNKKELENRKLYSKALLAKANPLSEKIIGTVLKGFKNNDLALIFQGFKNGHTNKLLKDSLLNKNFISYLNSYETKIYTFDSSEHSLYNQENNSYNTLNSILLTRAKPTAITNLYYYDLTYDRFTYITKKTITNSQNILLGYVFILASPKEYKTDELYPELFLNGYNNSIENSSIYSYAVYNNLQLVNSHNDVTFSSQLPKENVIAIGFSSTKKNGIDELYYTTGGSQVVIITKKNNSLIEYITIFSYLFCTFLIVSTLFWLLFIIASSRLKWKSVKSFWHLSIRNQIHVTIISVTLLSFVIIGVSTIVFFINRYHTDNRDQLNTVISEIQNEVMDVQNEVSTFYKSKKHTYAQREKLQREIIKISETHATDINLYDLDGKLRFSSTPIPYAKGFISTQMDPTAFFNFNTQKKIHFLQNEKIGNLQYLSNYVSLTDETGRQYAYLNIPYFTSEAKLKQEISNYLVAIVDLNAFLIVIAGIIALFIANKITRSFSFLSNRMKAVNLEKTNKAIVWKRADEIGALVNEYNAMVLKLNNSAIALAKSERESAWREMAKQVAHEIKNPLTPMKLSLQYLQKSIDNKAINLKELITSVANTIVEQIDHLNQIAGDFSQFANIGTVRNEIFDLTEVLKSVAQLFSLEENILLEWNLVDYPLLINADRTNINRVFTNLIQNAMQAVYPGTKSHIQVEEEVINGKALIRIKDNGSGIPMSIQSVIFEPNFTTKSSGTGLGLAMCKGIVEQCKGRIWFITSEDNGTTFFVELPLLD